MKKVLQLSRLTPRLDAFLQNYPEGTWNEFRDFNGGSAYKELIYTLMDRQHGLCSYCEINLTDNDHQVEHFHPKSDDSKGVNYWTFKISNLLAACRGGSYRYTNDTKRSLPPVKDNLSCGEAKTNKILDKIILNPASLSATPPVFAVNDAGEIKVEASNCQTVNIDVNQATATIKELNLNCRRLKNARVNVWQQLEDDFRQRTEDGESDQGALRNIAIYLLPDGDEKLPAFFTTIRVFCGAIGEELLAESLDVWL